MFELTEKQLAHYTIQRRLAHGGMSEVFLAYDEKKQCNVAIKVVNRSDEDYFAHFQSELKILSTLLHPHILPVFEFGEHGHWHYCVMPYIEHGTLREYIQQKPFDQAEAGEILEQIVSALQFAHEQGIIHRDIKPSNILFKDEHTIYLADFGLAKDMRADSTLTQAGCLIGTPEYLAPELAETAATPASDIYAVGILLYQMLTGTVPFKAATPMATYLKHINEEPRPPSLLNPAISYPIEQVILRALAKDPRHRYQTVQALARDYARALDDADLPHAQQTLSDQAGQEIRLVPLVPAPTPSQRIIRLLPARTSRRIHPGIFALVAAAICGLALSLALAFLTFHTVTPTTTMGAIIQFADVASVSGTPSKKTSPTRPATRQPTTHHYHPSNSSRGQSKSCEHGPGPKHKNRHGRGCDLTVVLSSSLNHILS